MYKYLIIEPLVVSEKYKIDKVNKNSIDLNYATKSLFDFYLNNQLSLCERSEITITALSDFYSSRHKNVMKECHGITEKIFQCANEADINTFYSMQLAVPVLKNGKISLILIEEK